MAISSSGSPNDGRAVDWLFPLASGRIPPVDCFSAIGVIVQRYVAGVRVKDGDDFGVPAGSVIPNKLKVEDRSRQTPRQQY
jgi:hypothetical protein